MRKSYIFSSAPSRTIIAYSKKIVNTVALLLAIFLIAGQANAQDLKPEAARQIKSLMNEKVSRTPAEKKISSQILYAFKTQAGQRLTTDVATLRTNVEKDANGRIKVDIDAAVTPQLLKELRALGSEIIFSSEKYGSITAKIPLDKAEEIAALDAVKHINYWVSPVHGSGLNAHLDNYKTINADDVERMRIPLKNNDGPVFDINYHPDFNTRVANVRKQLGSALKKVEYGEGFFSGSVTSQGDVTHKADVARVAFGTNGSGVKIGVLSDSYDTRPTGTNASDDVASGNLPGPGNPNGFTTPVTVLSDSPNGSDEGRAMLQIVHDLAPGAQLYFATAFISQASFAQQILDLRAAGCDIIIDDVSYYVESVFQDDNVAQAVNSVTASGALYFSSAANSGNKDDGTSSVWEGDFVDGGVLPLFPGGTMHNFSGGTLFNTFTTDGGPLILKWSDPLGLSAEDYDLFVTDNTGTSVLAASTDIQDGNDNAVEAIFANLSTGMRIYVLKKTGSFTRALHLNANGAELNFNTTGVMYGHNAAASAYSVAATPAAAAINIPGSPTGPYPGAFNSTNKVEVFSSDGPRRMFFNPNGSEITPGNILFGTNGGVLLAKPDITAADGVVTTLPPGGLNPFFGTSAAAPHAGAIAALIKSKLPSLTPAQIRTAIISSAIDIEAPGADRDAGAGIIMAYEALTAAGAPLCNLPTITAPTVTQPGCPSPTAGTIVVNATGSGTIEYSLNGGPYQVSNTFSGLVSGNYLITARLQGGDANCIASYSGNPVVINQPASTITFTAPTVTQPACPSPATGTIVVNATGGGPLEYSLNGGPYQISNTFSGLTAGNYNIIARIQGTTLCTQAYSGNPVVINPANGVTSTISYTGPAVAIPDGNANGVNIPLVVSGIGNFISDLNFRFDAVDPATCSSVANNPSASVTHSWVGDLVFKLTSPDGTTVTLISRPGGASNSGNNFCTVVLDDEGGFPSIQNVTIAQAPITGNFSPASLLSAFDGEDPNGTWILNVSDLVAQDAGVVRRFSLVINNELPCPGVPALLTTGVSGNIHACAGNASVNPALQRFHVTGYILTSDVTVTAPANFEISTDPDSGFGSLITLSPTAGTLNDTTIYVRSAATAPAGTISGNVTVASAGFTTINVTVTGTIGPVAIVSAPTVTQIVCGSHDGSIVVNATGDGVLEYSINGGVTWSTSNTFNNLSAGNYNVAARIQGVDPACFVSYSGNPVVIDPATTTIVYSDPTVTQTACPTPVTGTIVVNATAVGPLEYNLNDGPYQSSNTFSGLVPGNYNIKARLQASHVCIEAYAGNPVVINPPVSTIVFTAPNVTQPLCPSPSTGTIVVNATGGGALEYSIDGGAHWYASNTFSGLMSGNYNVKARLQGSHACVESYPGNPVVINPISPTVVFTAPTVTQIACPPATGTIVVNATAAGTLEYSLDNGPFQLSNTFSGLAAGSYNITARIVGTDATAACTASYSGNPVVISLPNQTVSTTSYTGPDVPIPDGNAAGVNIPLVVSGAGTVLGDLNFRLDAVPGGTCSSTIGNAFASVAHTWIGDLVFTLTSPHGTTVTLINRAGGESNSGNNFCTATLDDDGGYPSIQNVTIAQSPVTGNFSPSSPLSAFDGEDPNGTWILNVADMVTIDAGTLRRFSLVIASSNPCPPDLTINDVTHDEGNSGPTTYSFTVNLSSPAPAGGVTFNIATADNTATTANNDYVAKSLTSQTIPEGSSTYTFDVTVNGDNTVESDESFFVNVTNVIGASLVKGQGTGTITNDDVQAATSLTLVSNNPNPTCIGSVPSFTATLQQTTVPAGPIASQTVTFTITNSSAVIVSTQSGVTNAAGQATVTFAPNASPGTYTVQASFAGSASYTGSTSQVITYVVNPSPTVICPANITVSNDANQCGAVVTFAATASNSCPTTISYSPASGSFFPVGTTTVTATATSPTGISNSCTFTVTVNDVQPPTLTCPGPVTVSCASAVPPVNVSSVTGVSDNCSGGVTVTWDGDVISNQTCLNRYTITRTYKATDAAGNSASCTQIITVNDLTPPTFTLVAPYTVSCASQVPSPSQAEITSFGDNCSGTITAFAVDVISNQTCANKYTITRTYHVLDACGNEATASLIITVNDTQAPVPPSLQPIIAECSVTPTAPVAQDNCGPVTGTTTTPFPITTQGVTAIVWTFNDGCGNVSTATQYVFLNDVTPPVAPSSLPDVTGECGVTLTAPTAVDNCTGTITGTTFTPFPVTAQGTTVVVWIFNDGNGNISFATQNVIVNDVTPPVKPVLAPAIGQCDVTVPTPTTTDNCAGTINGYTIDPTYYNVQGTYVIYWYFTDHNGNTTVAKQMVKVQDTQAPVAPASLPNVTGTCSATPPTPTAIDNCEGVINGTTTTAFPITAQGTTVVTWTFADSRGNVSTVTQNVIITDAIPPTVNCPANISQAIIGNYCSKNVTVPNITYSDNCGNVTTLTWIMTGATTASSGATGINQIGAFTFNAGVTTVTVTAKDAAGNTNTCTFTVTLAESIFPTITCPSNKTVNADLNSCYATGVNLGTPIVSDNCGIASVTNDAPAQFPVGPTTVTWTVKDVSGNIKTSTQTVTVNDNQDPVINCPSNLAFIITSGCTYNLTPPTPTATDNCSIVKLTWVMTGATTGNSPSSGINYVPNTNFNVGVTTITYTAKDPSGRTASCYFKVTVNSTLQLTVTCPANIIQAAGNGKCNASVNVPNPVISNSCSNITCITWCMTGATEGNSESSGANYVGNRKFNVGETTVSYAVTNAAGQTAYCSSTVTVTESVPPTITCPSSKTVNNDYGKCFSTRVSLGSPKVSDNCGIRCVTSNAPDTFPVGVTYVIWTVTDNSGNTATCSQKVTVVDNQAPSLTCPMHIYQDAGAGCTATVVTPDPVYYDNCNVTKVTWAMTGATTASSPNTGYNMVGTYVFNKGNTTIAYTAKDPSGNTSTCSYVVTITDATPPVANCPTDVTFCKVANNTYTIPQMTRTDNCGIANTTYQITGVTNRNGSGTNASGTFNLGISTIKWTVTDADGNNSTCQTKVTITNCTVRTTTPVEDPKAPAPVAKETKTGKPEITITDSKLEVIAYPNPAEYFFNVKVKSAGKETVEIRMYDMLGKLVQVERGAPDQTYRFGDKVVGGMYMIEVRQAGEKAIIKVVKQ